MQTVNTHRISSVDLQKSYSWRLEEKAVVNTIIDAAWYNQRSSRSGLRPAASRLLRRILFLDRRDYM
jgi:hypothetical protein